MNIVVIVIGVIVFHLALNICYNLVKRNMPENTLRSILLNSIYLVKVIVTVFMIAYVLAVNKIKI